MGFNIGDVVQLTTNKEMTIQDISENGIHCIWFGNNGNFECETFCLDELTLIREYHLEQLSPNDKVQLQSGSISMQLEGFYQEEKDLSMGVNGAMMLYECMSNIDDGDAQCFWRNENNEKRDIYLNPKLLKKVY